MNKKKQKKNTICWWLREGFDLSTDELKGIHPCRDGLKWSLVKVVKDHRDKFPPPEKWVSSVSFQEQIWRIRQIIFPRLRQKHCLAIPIFKANISQIVFCVLCFCLALLNDSFCNLRSVSGFVIFYSFTIAHWKQRCIRAPACSPV